MKLERTRAVAEVLDSLVRHVCSWKSLKEECRVASKIELGLVTTGGRSDRPSRIKIKPPCSTTIDPSKGNSKEKDQKYGGLYFGDP